MVAKATTLLPKSSNPVIGDAIDLPKMSGPRGFQVNLEGKGQVAAVVQIQSTLDGTNFFPVKDISLGSINGYVCTGFFLDGHYAISTRAELKSIAGEDAMAEVLTA